jgi:hypothetical protein
VAPAKSFHCLMDIRMTEAYKLDIDLDVVFVQIATEDLDAFELTPD